MFSKLLIANRGEIAVRVIRACKEMGIATVAVYSKADEDALHVSLADQSVCIGGPYAKDSYLNASRIISAALATGAQAIHPGYGFLSENAEFANLCKEHGLVFVGPNPDVIDQMGDKDKARAIMEKAGVPVIPGSGILADIDEAKAEGQRIGYPLLIKARAGGGGKGIRLVSDADSLPGAYSAAIEEAKQAFGDGGLYMEKYLTRVKHVEVQVIADEHGNVVALGERECSVQRNNQKLVEEAPSVALTPAVRKKMFDTAIMAAKYVGYANAGTIEFLLEGENFYFMEMNTRLQVEHPVTEMVTGVDIVKWQIRIADGIPLGFTQDDVALAGASIECRINAASTGVVKFFHAPGGPNVRFDTALYQGYIVPPYYDSMLGKLIVHASTREDAIRKMLAALSELAIDGVACNIDEQIMIIDSWAFRSGQYYTDLKVDEMGEQVI
ncbi:MAG: acetyl-CoA carboxylase biotin carboxylase subunit [Defluviitaleaceae bacterium]|nr:acetyl-CoA carboxylase biotin carboxylase subunit [Defluviitaleaceae bacterium]